MTDASTATAPTPNDEDVHYDGSRPLRVNEQLPHGDDRRR